MQDPLTAVTVFCRFLDNSVLTVRLLNNAYVLRKYITQYALNAGDLLSGLDPGMDSGNNVLNVHW